MNKKYTYAILGAGKQGVAAAYDVILHGGAARVTLADADPALARKAAHRLRNLLGAALKQDNIALETLPLDGRNKESLVNVLQGHNAVLSAIPYYLNPAVADAAITVKAHYCDLGGYFETTQKILRMNGKAKRAGVALIPDCGVSPGMCNTLAVRGIEQMDKVEFVHMYCGGLPQSPRPPLFYKIVFNLEGLLGNYFGKAYVLKGGKVALVPSFSGREELEFPAPLGKLEAVVTGGATSSCPWTFRGKIPEYTYKTLRYPGHYDKIQFLKDLGLLDTAPVQVNGHAVSPRQVFVAAAGPKLAFPDDKDLLVQRVVVRGKKDGIDKEITYDVLDYYDAATGFTAMQRTTGFSAAIVLEMMAQGRVTARGAVPLEKSVPSSAFLEEIRRRGVRVSESIKTPERRKA